MSLSVKMRRAAIEDSQTLFDWRNDPDTRKVSRNSYSIAWDNHLSWMEKTVAAKDSILLIAIVDSQEVGTVRWDEVAPNVWEASITIAPESRGKGLALPILLLAEKEICPEPIQLVAAIHEDNFRSRNLFEAAHYVFDSGPDSTGYLTFIKNCVG